MSELLPGIAKLCTVLFMVSTMLRVGLNLSLREVIAPLRNVRRLSLAILVNFVIVPLIAVAIGQAMALQESLSSALLIMGLAAGAPFLPKAAETAGSDVALAVALMTLLMAGTIGFLPLALPLLMPGADVGTAQIIRSLLLFMVLPLVVGLTVKARFVPLAATLSVPLNRLANLTALLAVALYLGSNHASMANTLGSGVLIAGVLLVALSTLAGYLLGGPGRESRNVMALGAGLRNIPAGLVVAAGGFRDPQVTVMFIVLGLVGLIVLLPVARAVGRGAGGK